MIELEDVLKIFRAFNHEGVAYKVFGAIALNLHGIVRNTEDADFFVDPSPENVVKIKRALRSIWNDPNIDEIQDDDMIGDYPSFNYNPPNESFGIDVVSRLGEAFVYTDLPSQIIEFDGVSVPVVTAETLYAMKKNTVRYKDKLDAANLRERYSLKE
ncbi:MAG TPA: nucleotidyl transferase AbiEii/AbiGii toxin family protein [Thermoanaerobaculia bacterium]|nr:nucleotidyl transferase AbiEii/AbiGii toxin family protein [Thermoanaerobaculia bacterium]